MGTCLSKKKPTSSSFTPSHNNPSASVLSSFSVALSSSAQARTVVVPVLYPKPRKQPQPQQQPVEEQPSGGPAKEVFLIKHRKSHDERDRNPKPTTSDQEDQSDGPVAQIRTKEEVDAILIQCGRVSRSSSGKAASGSGRRYSGSKRSFNFDSAAADDEASETPAEDTASEKRVRERRCHSPSPQGRRRTPSREREKERSSSRERRISRSPGRRCAEASPSDAAAAQASNSRPGKMISVPATVSSLVMDKSNNNSGGSVKRISVKRNVGAASPRAQPPARAKPTPPLSSNELPQQQGGASLSRNSSRKAEISLFRRNPLSEIDPNSLAYPNRSQSRRKREAEGADDTQAQKPSAVTNHRSNGGVAMDNKTTINNLNCAPKEQEATVETTVVQHSGLHTVTRTRSARRSRDLDFNPESLLNPTTTPSYTRLLLEDIQNFHQKNGSSNTATVLPACVSKACSILEAVADLNNNANSDVSRAFSEDKCNKTLGGPKDPFMESEVVGCDDLMEPSFHRYVTVKRGTGAGVEVEDQESSGSNSFVGGSSSSQLSNWGLSPSSWEPNSADSTDCWTSRSREDDRLCGRKRESHGTGGMRIGRGRLGSAKGLYPAPVVAAATADST